jgi:hypothetical protein
MPETFFKITLSLEVKGGQASLMPPKGLKGLEVGFVIVKQGGKEAIVSVEGPQKKLNKLEKSKDCQKLTSKQAQELKEAYAQPRITRKYRLRTQAPAGSKDLNVDEQRETDEKGNPIIDNYQTVRCGFHVIDVLLVGQGF